MGQLVDCFEAGPDVDKVSVTQGRCLSLSLSIRTMKQSSGDWHLNIPETQTHWTWTWLSRGRYTGDTSTAAEMLPSTKVDMFIERTAGLLEKNGEETSIISMV